MRIKIRKGVFETNSSSMHSLVVKKENEYYTQEEMTGRMYLDDNGVWKIWSDDDLHFGREPFQCLGDFSKKVKYAIASLCVEALGKDRVFGVKLPCGVQPDINFATQLINHLEIKHCTVNILNAVNAIKNKFPKDINISNQTIINLPARIRMSTLYAISQSMNGRVANTCNLSEDWIGYSTRYGDSAGDFSPLANLTKTEVREIGKVLGLPEELVNKTPTDGLCGKPDEANFGFTYDMLDEYIRTGMIDNEVIKNKIDIMHAKNLFKLQLMPSFKPELSDLISSEF